MDYIIQIAKSCGYGRTRSGTGFTIVDSVQSDEGISQNFTQWGNRMTFVSPNDILFFDQFTCSCIPCDIVFPAKIIRSVGIAAVSYGVIVS